MRQHFLIYSLTLFLLYSHDKHSKAFAGTVTDLLMNYLSQQGGLPVMARSCTVRFPRCYCLIEDAYVSGNTENLSHKMQ